MYEYISQALLNPRLIHTVDGWIFVGYQFSWFSWWVRSTNSTHEEAIFCMKENALATNLEPHECVIFAQSTKIGTHENKAIHSITKSAKPYNTFPWL